MEAQFAKTAVAATVHHPVSMEISEQDKMLARVGQITRTLHDSLRELGFDKVLEKATIDIPDVRDRLNYVARMTEQAAQRVLNATDTAIPFARAHRVRRRRDFAWVASCAESPVLRSQLSRYGHVDHAMSDRHEK